MRYFTMNGYLWKVRFVAPNDPMLVDRTGTLTVATTDYSTLTIYISNAIRGRFLNRVLIHELGHCALFSFNLLDDIHRIVDPSRWVDAEEWICNLIADYGMFIYSSAQEILGDRALVVVSKRIEHALLSEVN